MQQHPKAFWQLQLLPNRSHMQVQQGSTAALSRFGIRYVLMSYP
jgi:hypothetical protein